MVSLIHIIIHCSVYKAESHTSKTDCKIKGPVIFNNDSLQICHVCCIYYSKNQS